MSLDKVALLAEMALKTETVSLPSGSVMLSELSAESYMDAYESPLAKDATGAYSGVRFTALLVARCAVDDAGNRILSDEDADTFRAGSSGTFRKLSEAVNRLNGLAGDEIKN